MSLTRCERWWGCEFFFFDRCNACKDCVYGVLLFLALYGKVRVPRVDLESKPENCVKRARR